MRWVAQTLGVAARTLWDWLARWGEGLLAALGRRGRKRETLRGPLRRAVLEILWLHPQIGARRLARLVPGLSRRTLSDWKERVTRRKARSAALRMERCVWERAGAVWAMDHTELWAELDGGRRQVLLVRDLASGMELSTVAGTTTGEEVALELERLFERWGAPLVIKCDNGSALVAGEVIELAKTWGVVVLRSPPRMPAYNGAAERGLGWWKLLVGGCVEMAQREGTISLQDLEQGR